MRFDIRTDRSSRAAPSRNTAGAMRRLVMSVPQQPVPTLRTGYRLVSQLPPRPGEVGGAAGRAKVAEPYQLAEQAGEPHSVGCISLLLLDEQTGHQRPGHLQSATLTDQGQAEIGK